MKQFLTISILVTSLELATCSIAGISYRDPIDLSPSIRRFPRGEDPCNPLYWYPRHVPADCNQPPPIPMPLPPPGPPSLPSPPPPMPIPVPMPMPVPPMMPPFPPLAPPMPMYPAPSLYPAPPMYAAPPMYPAAPMYPPFMPASLPQAGLMPGIEGLVSPGGGINILPFSDAYADLLENHKQKMIRIRLQKLLDKYENYPRRRARRRKCGHNKCSRDSDY